MTMDTSTSTDPIGDGVVGDKLNYVNGAWVESQSGQWVTVTNPATGKEVGRVPFAGRDETRAAIDAAHEALAGWKALSAHDRAVYLQKAYELVLERQDDLARLITLENGKPVAEARGEVGFGANFLNWYAEEGKRTYGEIIPARMAGKRLQVTKEAVGVVGAITPWNFPCTMVLRKIAPALAAGCTVVLKPAELTPLTAMAIAEIFADAGLPAGVFNVLTGDPEAIGEELLTNPAVRKITFTGSTRVGKLLMRGAADQLKRVSFELGGQAPFIVFDDADIDMAVESAVAAKFLRAGGQSCICPNRYYIHEAVKDQFVEAFVAKASQLKVGNGMQDGVHVGPMINAVGVDKVAAHVEDAVALGAQIALGGERLTGDGYADGHFFAPTVLVDCSDDMKVSCEETFGPVAPMFTFDSVSEVIERANDVDYGLAAYVFTNDFSRALAVSEGLQFGMIGLNDGNPQTPEAPFGGFKESGFGKEGGRQGIEAYLQEKLVSIAL